VEALKKAEDEAYLAAKLNRADWALDETGGDVKFVAVPKPAEPVKPAAEPKKP
jgi:hypothetical protein